MHVVLGVLYAVYLPIVQYSVTPQLKIVSIVSSDIRFISRMLPLRWQAWNQTVHTEYLDVLPWHKSHNCAYVWQEWLLYRLHCPVEILGHEMVVLRAQKCKAVTWWRSLTDLNGLMIELQSTVHKRFLPIIFILSDQRGLKAQVFSKFCWDVDKCNSKIRRGRFDKSNTFRSFYKKHDYVFAILCKCTSQIFHDLPAVRLCWTGKKAKLNHSLWLILSGLCINSIFKNYVHKINIESICISSQKFYVYSLWAQRYQNEWLLAFFLMSFISFIVFMKETMKFCCLIFFLEIVWKGEILGILSL